MRPPWQQCVERARAKFMALGVLDMMSEDDVAAEAAVMFKSASARRPRVRSLLLLCLLLQCVSAGLQGLKHHRPASPAAGGHHSCCRCCVRSRAAAGHRRERVAAGRGFQYDCSCSSAACRRRVAVDARCAFSAARPLRSFRCRYRRPGGAS